MAQGVGSSFELSPSSEMQQRPILQTENKTPHSRYNHKNESGGFRFSLLKYHKWSSFTPEPEESTDDENDKEAVSKISENRSKHPIMRLKKRDSSLYGICPQINMKLIQCRYCHLVLKPSALKAHVERLRHERKHEAANKVEKTDRFSSSTAGDVTEKLEKINVVEDKTEKSPSQSHSSASDTSTLSTTFVAVANKFERNEVRRIRSLQLKPTSAKDVSVDSNIFERSSPLMESSSSYGRKRKLVEETTTTFQREPEISSAITARCRILEPQEIVINTNSPPPLAPITNEPQQPSVWIVTPPAMIIDGTFVMKPMDQEETEIDLKDLKLLKPTNLKEHTVESQSTLTPSNWYPTDKIRPLAVNTFNLRKYNSRYILTNHRKLVEIGRNMRTEEKNVSAPKTWSFIEQRNQVIIPFRITH